MLQHAVVAGPIPFALHQVQIPNYATGKIPLHYNRAFSMFYGWWDTGGCSSFTNSSPHIDPPIWLEVFELWFVSPKDFISLLYCPVFMHLGPLDTFDVVLVPQQWFLQILLCMSASQVFSHFFHDIGSVVQWCFEQSTFQHKLVTLVK